MVKPAPVDHVAIEETLEKVVPGALILTKDLVRTVVMIERDRDIFGMAYDIHPFAVALYHHCGVQPKRHVRGDDAARRGPSMWSYAPLHRPHCRSHGEEFQDLALALGMLQRRNVALVEDGVEHLIGPAVPDRGYELNQTSSAR